MLKLILKSPIWGQYDRIWMPSLTSLLLYPYIGQYLRDVEQDVPDPATCKQKVDHVVNVALKAEGYNIRDSHVSQKSGKRMIWVDPVTHEAKLAYR